MTRKASSSLELQSRTYPSLHFSLSSSRHKLQRQETANNNKLVSDLTTMPFSIVSSAFTFILMARPAVYAFSSTYKSRQTSPLFYRSIHHGPDVEPLTDAEKLGADFTKMNKQLITNYGPGSFDDLVDFTDQFDGGDSEMGVTGDGIVRLQTIGR